MPFAERYAFPIDARIGTSIPRTNDFKELFYVRWRSIWFNVFWGPDLNIKVVLNVYRSCGVCERFIVDTDSYDVQWDRHKRVTRDLYIYPSPAKLGHVTRVTFSHARRLYCRHSGRARHQSRHDRQLLDTRTQCHADARDSPLALFCGVVDETVAWHL
ncbi:MAG: hypothetical protein WB822_08875 [Rhodoplanes sp.]